MAARAGESAGAGQTTTAGSRSTLACLACRAKKQKCTGERPTCKQCQTAHRVCEWPQLQKRGPFKGYLEAIEGRLMRTEDLLVEALSLLSEAQVAHIVRVAASEPSRSFDAAGQTMSKHNPTLWAEYPLDTPGDVRRWWLRRTGAEASQPTHEVPDMIPHTLVPSVVSHSSPARSGTTSQPGRPSPAAMSEMRPSPSPGFDSNPYHLATPEATIPFPERTDFGDRAIQNMQYIHPPNAPDQPSGDLDDDIFW